MVFRIIGITCLIIGIILLVSSISSFFNDTTHMDPFSRDFERPNVGKGFIGIPLIFIGAVFTSLGFMGEVARYQAQEMAPVGKDVVNYMVDGTKDSIKTVARSIKEGLSDDYLDKKVTCRRCLTENDSDAKYCDNCGFRIL